MPVSPLLSPEAPGVAVAGAVDAEGTEDEAAAGAVAGSKAGCAAAGAPDWAAAMMFAKKRIPTKEPEPTIRIKAFWEPIMPIER